MNISSRRQMLTAVTSIATAGVLAGCTESGDADDSGTGDSDGNESEATDETDSTGDNSGGTETAGSTEDDETGDGTETDSSGSDELDLAEANVVDVEFQAENGSYTFDVTLHHDDGGEEGYANWWQVEQLDGTRLGRRELLHAHSQQPFTRSETIDITDQDACVVVRGHDQTHGYGGQAMLVNLDSNSVQAVEQGEEQQSFDSTDCP